jgi:hypothetical protein
MRFVATCILFLVLLSSEATCADDQKNTPPASSEQIKISAVTLTALIKGAVVAVHQANLTGNYSVLRDLGTPMFRERFDQTALAAVFQGLRARKIDLGVVSLLSPNLTKQPQYIQDQLLLTGEFPTKPLKVRFILAFTPLDGIWRLSNISVNVVEAQAMANAEQAAPTSSPDPGQTAPSQWATGQTSVPTKSSKIAAPPVK